MRVLALVLVVAVASTAGVAPAVGSPQSDPGDCTYDEGELREYQPETAVDHLDVKPTASYGGIFSSPERDATVYVYFLYYETQDGVTPLDSHDPDREPVYVVVDDDSGEIERVQYSAYHYVKGAATPSNLSTNGSHVQLRAVEPWHHYRPAAVAGSYPDLKNYCTAVDRWTADGWGAASEAVKEPWTMRERASWWPEDSLRETAASGYRDARSSLDAIDVVGNDTDG